MTNRTRTWPPRRTAARTVLYGNGYFALALASALALFTAAATVGAGGQWTAMHLWLAGAVAFLGTTALLCFALGSRRARTRRIVVQLAPAAAPARGDSPRGESPLQSPVLNPS